MIIEQRIFSAKGQLMLRSRTPQITDLREYRDELRPHIRRMRIKRYDGKRGVFFELDDLRMVVIILGRDDEAMADTITTSMDKVSIVAD